MTRRFRRSTLSAVLLLAASGLATAGMASAASAATNQITVTAPATEQSTVGAAVSVQVTATDSDSGATLSYSADGLPAGLSIDSSTGLISGTPTGLASGPVIVTATDGTGATGSADISWQAGGNITINASGGGAATPMGATINQPFAVSDNAAGDILTYDSSQLPRGLHLDPADSLITGWQLDQTKSATVTVKGLDGGTASRTLAFDPTAATAGATGTARLDMGGKCMDDRADSSADGTRVQDWACNGAASQQWTYYSDGTIRINGKCLTVQPTTADYSRADLATCVANGSASQEWVTTTAGQLQSLLPGPPLGFCLADGTAGTVNGTQLYVSVCGGLGDRQGEWTLPAQTVSSAIAGRCLDDSRATAVNGAVVDAATCNGKATQHWTVEPDGTIRVNGECLDDRANGSTIGTRIQLWTCISGDANQQWTITGDVNTLGLRLQHGSLCVAPTSFTAATSAQLILDSCSGDKTYWHAW